MQPAAVGIPAIFSAQISSPVHLLEIFERRKNRVIRAMARISVCENFLLNSKLLHLHIYYVYLQSYLPGGFYTTVYNKSTSMVFKYGTEGMWVYTYNTI